MQPLEDYAIIHNLDRALDKYMYLRILQVANAAEYYRVLLAHAEEMLPFIYTPTVGQACQERHLLLQDGLPEVGITFRIDRDSGHILQRLRGLPNQDVTVIVVTDGERILGLGDLGANGMGISEGKISLYTAAAGVDPNVCLPVCLDVGTNNKALLVHPAYRGVRSPRPSHAEYHAFVHEFMSALKQWRPHVLLQFEDFANHTAFELLERYRGTHCCFNDDIQGTAAVCLAAVLAALRVTQSGGLREQRVLFLGAGEAAAGIASLMAGHMSSRGGLGIAEARARCFLVDTKGLVCASRGGAELAEHKRPFAHDVPHQRDLKAAIRAIRPTVLIGAAATAGAFDEEVIRLMASYNQRPIIMPLSNPTSKAECTFAQALAWSEGRVVFASGSPFEALPHPVTGKLVHPTQANNAYIFPALGHAAVLAHARTLTDDVFLAAADALASLSTQEELEQNILFPSFSRVREASAAVMAACVEAILRTGGGKLPTSWQGKDLRAQSLACMWNGPDDGLSSSSSSSSMGGGGTDASSVVRSGSLSSRLDPLSLGSMDAAARCLIGLAHKKKQPDAHHSPSKL